MGTGRAGAVPAQFMASLFSDPSSKFGMILQAYAKINLGLRILRRRADGFHAIETIFHRISLSDQLAITARAASIELSSTDPALPCDATNLCWKAVTLLQEACGTRQGASIHITKRIPMGAGLGGGSSDAAVVLRHLPRLWGHVLTDARLHELGALLGSDVPFFLQQSSAYAEGRGEQLTPFECQLPYWILLVNPGIHVSTPWAYKEFSKKLSEGYQVPRGTLFSPEAHRMHPLSKVLYNDFEDVVFPAYPAIGELKQTLLASGAAYALMSGSGSSVFALFEDERRARSAQAACASYPFTSLTEPFFIPA